jgi:hypothetical protein
MDTRYVKKGIDVDFGSLVDAIFGKFNKKSFDKNGETIPKNGEIIKRKSPFISEIDSIKQKYPSISERLSKVKNRRNLTTLVNKTNRSKVENIICNMFELILLMGKRGDWECDWECFLGDIVYEYYNELLNEEK